MSFLGALVGGVGSLLGGIFQGQGAQKGGKMSAKATLKANQQNLKYQKQFAQRGIRWRVRDAKRAGIHPLAALGAQTTAFSPSFVGATQAGEGVAQSAAAMGQGISRAAQAFGDVDDRQTDFLAKLQALQLDNMGLQNAALASQIAQINQAGQPPAAPPAVADRYLINGQGQTVGGATTLVEDQPLKRVVADPNLPSQEPGAVTDVGFLRTRTGWAPVKSTDASQRLEDDMLGNIQHFVRNRIVQPLWSLKEGAPFKAPPGKVWAFDHVRGEYFLRDGGTTSRGPYRQTDMSGGGW
nr:MAG: DNA pilot protein [Microvirus sp.]